MHVALVNDAHLNERKVKYEYRMLGFKCGALSIANLVFA